MLPLEQLGRGLGLHPESQGWAFTDPDGRPTGQVFGGCTYGPPGPGAPVPYRDVVELEQGLHEIGWTSGDPLHRLASDVWTVLYGMHQRRQQAAMAAPRPGQVDVIAAVRQLWRRTRPTTLTRPGPRREIGRAS